MEATPWQLKVFSKSLKKKQKLAALRKHLGDLHEDKCLLITNGDNNGALNYHLRESGGMWTWSDLVELNISEMEDLLKQRVYHLDHKKFDLPSEHFDCVATLDIHEHLDDPKDFNREIVRVTKPGGRIIVITPCNSEGRVITKLRNSVGMTKEVYGHVREGYDISELEEMLRDSGIEPYSSSHYSKSFTELLELIINLTYAKGINRKQGEEQAIAPTTRNQVNSISFFFKIYSALNPFLQVISKLDVLLPFQQGYVVVVEGRKLATEHAETGTLESY